MGIAHEPEHEMADEGLVVPAVPPPFIEGGGLGVKPSKHHWLDPIEGQCDAFPDAVAVDGEDGLRDVDEVASYGTRTLVVADDLEKGLASDVSQMAAHLKGGVEVVVLGVGLGVVLLVDGVVEAIAALLGDLADGEHAPVQGERVVLLGIHLLAKPRHVPVEDLAGIPGL